MLYLEDYLEMIEHLPQELRDRFTEMRELDLSVQNNMDDLEKRVKVLFNEWKRNPNDLPPTADLEFEGIKKEYYKTLEDQDEKVVLANQMYELVDRYLRRLDTELHKFKCELEADNKGITELLEKRSLELDTPITSTTSSQKENRYERYTSSRPREKRRSDSCQSAGGVTYPEKRPHLTHSLSLGEQRHNVAATNGNNVLLASQLQQHVHQGSGSLHPITQSQQLATVSNTTATLSSPHHSNTHHSPHHINTHATIINTNSAPVNNPNQQQSLSTASTNTLGGLISTSHHQSISAASTTHHGQSMAMVGGVSQSSVSMTSSSQHQHNVGSSTVSVSVNCANGGGAMVTGASSSSSSGGGGGYTLVSGGAGPAIAAAASQAIAATQKMQQGRRTPSLKASYEAINSTGSGGLMKVNDLAIGRELAGAAQTAIQAIQHDSNKKKAKKYSTHHSSSLRHSIGGTSSSSAIVNQSQHVEMGDVDSYVGGVDVGVTADDISGVGGGGDDLTGANGEYIDSYDPNEPRYCLCNQVSYGDMVACDNEDCPSEWFHYPCVGITAPPKGKWYCPQCTSSMRRRGNRKN